MKFYFGILCLNVFFFTLILIGVLIFIILPNHEKQNIIIKTKKSIWYKISNNSISISIFIVFLILLLFIGFLCLSNQTWNTFIDGITTEIFGILADSILLLLVFNIITATSVKRRKINTLLDNIEDLRGLNSEESKFMIRGAIKRLNQLNHSKIDFYEIDISTNLKTRTKINFSNINLIESNGLHAKFDYLNMSDSKFDFIKMHYTTFIETALINGTFNHSYLSGVDFSNSVLIGADFSNATIISNTKFINADLKHIKFNNAYIKDTNFEDAIVNSDFLDINWKLQSEPNIFNEYKIVSHRVYNSTVYILKRI